MVDLHLPKERVVEIPASLWKRGLALLFDLFLLDFVVVSSFRGVITHLFPQGGAGEIRAIAEGDASVLLGINLLLLLIGVLFVAYFAILEYHLGATLGKMLFHLHVKSDRTPRRFWQCIVRSLLVIPIFPFIILWIVDPLHMLFSIEGRRWSERISQTRVVEYIIGVY